MPEPAFRRIALSAHASTPSPAIQRLEVLVGVPGPGALELRYLLQGDLSLIRLVPQESLCPGRADNLWQHTCFEAFIQPVGSQSYCELNFSVAKQWAAYRFDAYRAGMRPLELARPPEISVTHTSQQLELHATVALASEYRPALLGLTAVVEHDSGRLCYWSARHSPGKPDFHHRDGFVLEIQLPTNS